MFKLSQGLTKTIVSIKSILIARCEDLIHELLPKSVAKSLIAQRPVAAQLYKSCTIYLRDANK